MSFILSSLSTSFKQKEASSFSLYTLGFALKGTYLKWTDRFSSPNRLERKLPASPGRLQIIGSAFGWLARCSLRGTLGIACPKFIKGSKANLHHRRMRWVDTRPPHSRACKAGFMSRLRPEEVLNFPNLTCPQRLLTDNWTSDGKYWDETYLSVVGYVKLFDFLSFEGAFLSRQQIS